MKAPLIVLAIIVITILIFFGYFSFQKNDKSDFNSEKSLQEVERPLDVYTIENLSERKFEASSIEIGNVIDDGEFVKSRIFYFFVDGRKVSGQLNLPKTAGRYPVILMSRGYIDRETYKTGDGTRRSGEELAKAGFITLAPDFLGYGESDNPGNDVMEDRFLTYVTVLTLLSSLDSFNESLDKVEPGFVIDTEKVGLWGHSNGGQITLTVLEITGGSYPTVLWAPVSKPFPYSILYYTDEFEDGGKALRKVVAEFEDKYDSDKYSLTNYLERVNAPIELFQGTDDDAVDETWSRELYEKLNDMGKKIQYYTYADDHNFSRGSWPTIVSRNIDFYKESFE